MPTFNLLTFGCQMNVRDSQWLEAALLDRGLELAPAEQADYIILNTCAIRAKPEAKVMNVIDRLRCATKGRAKYVVLGCVAQQHGKKLLEGHKDIVCIAGNDNLAFIPEILEQGGEREHPACLLDIPASFCERPKIAEIPRARSAFVNIMQGCDNFCAYCIVPFTRGRQKSRSAAAIIKECESWLEKGAIELILLGQNVNAWGSDHSSGDNFASLLHRINRLPGLQRLRFLTSHPKDLEDQIINCFGELTTLCPDLHLPLQSGSDRILSLMGRRYNRDKYLALVAKLRQVRPDLSLSTDLIVGFPGETEDDFSDTLEMMNECRFASSFSFCYSDRPGTRAYSMNDKIPPDVQKERLARLQRLQTHLTAQWLAKRIGSEAEVLVESQAGKGDAGIWRGKDIYGTAITFTLPESGDHSGSLINVKITGAGVGSLKALPLIRI